MLKYNPALDGLRAISFLIVFLFHCNIPGFQFGWCGVNIFFVLSGYLITGILLRAKESPNYFSSFYMRRVLRIFPIYYAIILLMFLLWIILDKGEKFKIFYYLTYTQNIFHAFGAEDPIKGPLFHTWTLAIEEQFYLFWPVVVYYLNRKALFRTCVGIILISPFIRIALYLASDNIYLSNMLLFSQMDSLAFGALLSLIMLHYTTVNATRLKRGMALTGVFLFLVLTYLVGKGAGATGFVHPFIVGYDSYKTPEGYMTTWFGPFIFSALGFLSCAAILLCYDNKHVHKVLSSGPLVHIGKISYGLYLYHWIVIIFLKSFSKKYPLDPTSFFLISLGTTYVVSLVSYYTIERYFITKKKTFVYEK